MCPFFSWKVLWFLLHEIPLQYKTCYLMSIFFGQKFIRNAKNGSGCLKLIWSGTFEIFNTEPFWFWSRIRSRVKISHYIQPSNLYRALCCSICFENLKCEIGKHLGIQLCKLIFVFILIVLDITSVPQKR